MPHFIIECPETLMLPEMAEQLVERVHQVAMNSGLFEEANVKVRLKTYKHYKIAGKAQDFLHVFGYIMRGRTPEQQTDLSHSIGELLTCVFPRVPVITVNIDTLNKPTYFKRLI